jgi:catechol-2,3-dioxygenase
MTIELTRVAHVGLRTQQMERMHTYLTDVLGLWVACSDPDGRVHYARGGRGAIVELIPADQPALDHVAFETAAGVATDRIKAELEAAGMTPTDWGPSDPGAARSLRIEDPEGNNIQIVLPDETFERFRDGPGILPTKLSHVATRVANGRTVMNFYTGALGFRFSDSLADLFYFLRCNSDHHAVNLLELPPFGQLHHVAFELESADEMRRANDLLSSHDIPLAWGMGRHGPGHNLFSYHRDPDGRIIELNSGLDRMSHEGQGYFDPKPWHTHSPQTPRRWDPQNPDDRDRWGPPPPADFM